MATASGTGIRYRVRRPCWIRAYEGQEMPEHYGVDDEVLIEEALHEIEEGKLVLPGKGYAKCLERIGVEGTSLSDSPAKVEPQPTDQSRVMMIRRACGKLDDANDDHWTRQRTPAVNVVNYLAGMPSPPIRSQEIKTVCPGLLRGIGGKYAAAR